MYCLNIFNENILLSIKSKNNKALNKILIFRWQNGNVAMFKEKRVLLSSKYIIEAFTYETIACLAEGREKWGV